MPDDGPFTLQAYLAGMAPDDLIRLELPSECRRLSLSDLLDRAFPESPEERREIAAQFDPGTCNYRANPDLPEIYAVFLAVCDEWRDWRCALRATSADGADVDLSAPVSSLLTAGPGDSATSAEESSVHPEPALAVHPEPALTVHPEPVEGRTDCLFLRLEQQYRALEYAERHGFWPDRWALLDWMRSLTALYFLDKHEVALHPGALPEPAFALRDALTSLQSQGLIAATPPENPPLPEEEDQGEAVPGDTAPYVITPLGRRFIAGLLTETESLIDQYDHYKDTVVDPLSLPPHRGGIQGGAAVEFDTGRGADLRVEAFLADGLDPIRAVFLLRLYDGAFDHRLRDWQDAIEGEEFYEGILEPVVNRDGATPEAMEVVIESGLSWLEEQQEQARREAAEREILRRAEGDLD